MLPLQNRAAETIAELLKERVFSYLGMPEQIHTDQGMQFKSRLMVTLCAIREVQKGHTTPTTLRPTGWLIDATET